MTAFKDCVQELAGQAFVNRTTADIYFKIKSYSTLYYSQSADLLKSFSKLIISIFTFLNH